MLMPIKKKDHYNLCPVLLGNDSTSFLTKIYVQKRLVNYILKYVPYIQIQSYFRYAFRTKAVQNTFVSFECKKCTFPFFVCSEGSMDTVSQSP